MQLRKKLVMSQQNAVASQGVDGFHVLAAVLLCMGAIVADVPAFAQGGLAGGLCEAVQMMTGPAGKAVATSGIIVIAVGALLGRVSWGMAVMIAAGIAGIFGAPTIASAIATASGGSGGGFCE